MASPTTVDADGSYVLCVEDEPILLRGVVRVLGAAGHRVVGAGTLRMAHETLRVEGPPAVVLTDLQLPDGSGIELLTAVARAHPSTVGLVLTGRPDQGSMLVGINEARVLRYLVKPFGMKELREVVAEAMAEHLVRRQLRVPGASPPTSGRRAVYVRDLAASMVLEADVSTRDGMLLALSGAELTPLLIEKLVKIARTRGVREPLLVRERNAQR